MGDEQDRILKLLEDGKISADQAARLIEALGARPAEQAPEPPIPPLVMGRHWRRHSWQGTDRIPDIVAKAVTAAVRFEAEGADEEQRTSEFPDKRDLFIKTVSGDVEVRGRAEAGIQVRHGVKMVRARSREGAVAVNSVSGDVAAEMPADGRLELVTVSGDASVVGVGGGLVLKTVSGDATLYGVSGRISVMMVSGDVALAGVAGEIEVGTKSGDVSIAAAGAVSGAVNTRSGDVTLVLSRDADLMMELASEYGDIGVEFSAPHEILEDGERFVRVKLGAGTRVLAVRTESGDIVVREQEEQQ